MKSPYFLLCRGKIYAYNLVSINKVIMLKCGLIVGIYATMFNLFGKKYLYVRFNANIY